MEEYDYLFKVIVLGDGGAGKTALTVRFSQGYFQESYKMTVGVDFSVKLIEVGTPQGKTKVKLQTWDTGGQERFSFVRPLYYRGAMGALLVFDVTNRESFDHLPNWIEELQSNADPVPFVLVGNKIDLPRAVSPDEAWQFAQQFGIKYYYETSAKTGEEVGDCFYALAHEMIGIPLPVSQYPAVMKQLGLGAAPAPAAVAPAPQPVHAAPAPVPAPVAAAQDMNFASEYGDFDNGDFEPVAPPPRPAPVVQPVPRPVAVPVAQPVPKPVAVALPKPAAVPVAQPVPRPVVVPVAQPVPRPVVVPVAQPVPKPVAVPIPAPAAQPAPRPQSIGLFQAQPVPAAESAPIEVPELPVARPPAARVAKPIPVAPATVEEAMPDLEPVHEARQVKPAPAAQPASGPVLFQPKPLAAAPAQVKAKDTPPTPKPDSRSAATFNFSQALAAKSQSKTGGGQGTAGFTPFSSGFTASKPATSGGGSGAMNFFIQTSVPENLLNLKKQKKKKPAAPGEVSDLIKCPGCGYSVSNKMRFCNKCGSKLK